MAANPDRRGVGYSGSGGQIKAGRWRQAPTGKIEKRCNKCRRWLPATREAYDARQDSPDGLAYWCRGCHRLALGRPREGKWRRSVVRAAEA